MADSVELQISVTSLQRVDPYVKEILATSAHVALYKFNPVNNEWEKSDTEGALFVYTRSGEPFHSIMILNRLNTKNLIEPIVKEFDYQMQTPFLLYRNSKSKIYGIWFFTPDDCVRITYLLESLMDGLKENSTSKSKKKEKCVDILSMLSKAQQDFNKTPVKTETQPQFSSTPRAPDVTSQSVMDFFAKASGKTTQKPAVTVSTNENILQRLMSNPAHSVEHIEKQQRSITPQEQIQFKQKVDRRSVPVTFPNANVTSERKNDSVENFFRVHSPQQHPASPLAMLIQSQNAMAEDTLEVSGTSPLAQLLDTPQKPALMPPMMFTSSSLKEKNESSLSFQFGGPQKEKGDSNVTTNQSFTPLSLHALKEKGDASAISNAERFKNVEPLTKNQMLQALNYLLRTDSDFVIKLHEAYVKSFTEMVNQNTTNN